MPPTHSPFLPEDYTLGPQDVIIGRGNRCKNNPGNIRFKAIIQATLTSYSNALTKLQKSVLITDVLTQIRGNDGVGFVKRDSATGRYTIVEEAASRIAIAQSFRDALSGIYKSSKKHKQVKRIERLNSKNDSETTEAVPPSTFEDTFDPIPLQKLTDEPDSCRGFSEFIPVQKLTDEPDSCRDSSESSSGISMMLLRGILHEASTAVNPNHDLGASFTSLSTGAIFSSPPNNEHGNDIFSKLYSVFGSELGGINSEDPFEPTPLADDSPNVPALHLYKL